MKKDLTGSKFGRLTVVGVVFRMEVNGLVRFQKCICECGNECAVKAYSLEHHSSVSCGCWKTDGKHVKFGIEHHNFKHGKSGTKIYVAWVEMFKRCYNPKVFGYEYYGGRGIKVSDDWRSFDKFYADMGDPPYDSRNWSLDRIDVNGMYEHGNVRWSNRETQSRNRRNNVWIECNGERMILSEWGRRVGLHPMTIRHRLKIGWSIDKALFTKSMSSRRK